MNFIDKPYSCVHGICNRNPSCYGGACPDKPKRRLAAAERREHEPWIDLTGAMSKGAYVNYSQPGGMHVHNSNYPYCAAGVCNYYGSCGGRGECVLALAAHGKASDDELEDILEGSPQMMACTSEEERQALRKAFFGTKTLGEACEEFARHCSHNELKDQMTQRPVTPMFSFMWGFPYAYEVSPLRDTGKAMPPEPDDGRIGDGTIRLSPEEAMIRDWGYDVGTAYDDTPERAREALRRVGAVNNKVGGLEDGRIGTGGQQERRRESWDKLSGETLEEMSDRLSEHRARRYFAEEDAAEDAPSYNDRAAEIIADFYNRNCILPQDSQERKDTPICTGAVDYFPRALAYVAKVSKASNDKHNPGEPMHWSKHISTDHADCLVRHLVERGDLDNDGLRHSGKVAWRALALLEMELEASDMNCTVEELIDGYAAEAE